MRVVQQSHQRCTLVWVDDILPYLTLPYHTGKTFYRLALMPLTGPMRIPELTVRLQNPQVQYSPGSIPIPRTIPLHLLGTELETHSDWRLTVVSYHDHQYSAARWLKG